MVITRVLFHMAIIGLLLNLIDRALTDQYVPYAHMLLDLIRPGQYFLFAITVASVLNRRPAFLTIIFAVALLLTYQRIQDDLITIGIAILLGVLMARGILALSNEANPDEEEP